MKPLLVGEANPHGSDPKFALYPHPRGAAGDRLCRLIMGLSAGDYMARYDRVNLCPRDWSAREARERAEEITHGEKRTVVMLGSKVALAFGVEFVPFTHWGALGGIRVVLPHPSGLSRAWNEPGAYERAAAVLRAAGVL